MLLETSWTIAKKCKEILNKMEVREHVYVNFTEVQFF